MSQAIKLTPVPINGIEKFLDIKRLEHEINDGNLTTALKSAVRHATETMHESFKAKEDIRKLIYGRAWVIDQILRVAWQHFDWPDESKVSLIAVGGYGRGELHPHSDVDILILIDGVEAESFEETISGFLTLLWDINLDIGSSVRSEERRVGK